MYWDVEIKMDEARKPVLEKLSELLTSSWSDAKNPAQIAREIIPLNLEEAYFVQDRMHQLLDANISGWKVGATSPKMREIDGHEDIIPGRIFCSRTYTGAYQSMDINLFPNARAEAEFGFRLLEKPEVRRQPWTATEISSIMVLHPAVELIGNRFRTDGLSKREKSLLTVADNGGGIGFVFGDPVVNWSDINFKYHKISLTVNDRAAATNFLGDMRCFPVQAATDLVNHLNKRGISLSEGDFISTGAATMPQSFGAGDVINANFGELGFIELGF